jgi:hypothetical protein
MQAEIPRAFLRTALAEYLAAPAADEGSGAPRCGPENSVARAEIARS